MRILLLLPVLWCLTVHAQVSYWFSEFQRQGNAQLAQQYFFHPGTNVVITYDGTYVYINASGGGGSITTNNYYYTTNYYTTNVYTITTNNYTITTNTYVTNLYTITTNTYTTNIYTLTQTNIYATNLIGLLATNGIAFYTNALGWLIISNSSPGVSTTGYLTNFSSFNWTNTSSIVSHNAGTILLQNNGLADFWAPSYGHVSISYGGSPYSDAQVSAGWTGNGQNIEMINHPYTPSAQVLFTDSSGNPANVNFTPVGIVTVGPSLVIQTAGFGNGIGITNCQFSSHLLTNSVLLQGVITNLNIVTGTNMFVTVSNVNGQANIAVSLVNNPTVTNLTIPATTSASLGTINQNGVNLISTYGTANLFEGTALSSGNFTLSGSYNVGLGRACLQDLTSGINNVALGNAALASLTSGSDNMAIGGNALGSQTTSGDCVAVGALALNSCTAAFNVGIGTGALQNSVGGAGNVAVGRAAGDSITSGAYNTFIGYNAGLNGSQKVDAQNSMSLGNSTYNWADNQVVIGNTNVTDTELNGDVHTPGNVFGTNGLWFVANSNGIAAAMNVATPTHAFGFMSLTNASGQAITISSTSGYYAVTNFNYIYTNLFVGAMTNGYLTNVYAGWYKISCGVSMIPIAGQDTCEVELQFSGNHDERIAGHQTASQGTAKAMNLFAEGILFLPAGSYMQCGISDETSTGTITVLHCQFIISGL